MNNTKNSNSGFWVDSNVLDQDTDVITLNGYRRSIANFVRIVTGKPIPVRFNVQDHSFTDGETVVISGVIKNNEFDCAVGLACHEGSHIVHSDFELVKRLVGNKSNPFQDGLLDEKLVTDVMSKYNVSREYAENYVKITLKNLLNWVEDRRIDHYTFTTSPGYKGYYHAMYDKYFHSELVDKGILSPQYREETLSNYMFRIINLTNKNRDLDALKGLQEIWDIIDLENIDRLKSSQDALDVALEVYLVIEKNVEGFDTQKDDSDMSSDDSDDTDQDDTDSGESDCDCDGEGEGEGRQGEGQANTGGGGQPDPHNDFKGGKGEGGEAQGESSNDPGESMEGDMEDGDNGSGGEADGEGSQGKGSGQGSGDDKGDAKGDGDGEDGDGDAKGSPNDSNGAGGSGGKTGEGTPLTAEEAEAIKADIAKQREFLDGKVDKETITEEKSEELKAVEEANSSMENVGKTYGEANNSRYTSIRKHGINCIVYRNMTRSFIESGACPFSYKHYWSGGDSKGYEKAIVEGLQKGTILGKKMAVRQESRQTYYNRQRQGGLDNRIVAEAGFGNSKIFGHKEIEQYAPAYVHISIDASGSMSGDRFYQAQVAAVAIAKAATMVEGLDCVISYRGCTNSRPAIMIAYDSRQDSISKIRNLFGAICPTGSTPEGLCFEAVLNEIVMGNSKQHSYFVNMSDGEPGFGGVIASDEHEYLRYGGEDAVNHTRQMVDKIRQRGVHVLSYFIGRGDSNENFRKMYGKDASFVDVNNMMVIARTMNKLFMKKK